MSTPREVKSSTAQYSEADLEADQINGRFETVNAVFSAMEACDNAVVADRVSIFANVCLFWWMLNTVRYRKEKMSYSTCVLALLILKILKGHNSATKERLVKRLMEMNNGEYYKRWVVSVFKNVI